MPKYIAFLRAINVGGHIVKMDELREQFTALGFANVETFIASGNVIFDSPTKSARKLEQQIELHLRTWLGYNVETLIRTPAELAAIAQYEPFAAAEIAAAGALHVVFLATEPPADAATKLREVATAVDELHLHGRELYWLCRVKFNESKVKPTQLDKALGKTPATARSITTIRKLVAKYGKPSASGPLG